MPDQIHKVILRFLSDLGDLKMRRMFVVYSSFLCWGIKPTSAQMAVMISPITIQSNNENCTETNTYYDRYFEIKYSTITQRKLYEQVFGTIHSFYFDLNFKLYPSPFPLVQFIHLGERVPLSPSRKSFHRHSTGKGKIRLIFLIF